MLRPTYLDVDLGQLVRNYHALSRWTAPIPIMPVLKANAYGHGLVPTAEVLAPLNLPYIALAFVEEGMLLRQAGIKTPLLLLTALFPQQIDVCLEYDLTITVPSLEFLRQVEQVAKKAGKVAQIHLKIDTGMGRIGIDAADAELLLEAAELAEHCQVLGIYSHFATADNRPEQLHFAQAQVGRFGRVLDFYGRQNRTLPAWRHISNSAGLLQVPSAHFNIMRAGIVLYGVYPSGDTTRSAKVETAVTWRTQIAFVKRLPAQRSIGYGATWVSEKETTIGTLPVGYGDGYFRLLSNRGAVLVNGKRYPIVGRVCMDQVMIDFGDDEAAVGDEVVLLGKQGSEMITPDEVANWAETIPYEVLTNIGMRVPRVYRDE